MAGVDSDSDGPRLFGTSPIGGGMSASGAIKACRARIDDRHPHGREVPHLLGIAQRQGLQRGLGSRVGAPIGAGLPADACAHEAGQGIKFARPMVVNGKVFVQSVGKVCVYGLLPPPTAG